MPHNIYFLLAREKKEIEREREKLRAILSSIRISRGLCIQIEEFEKTIWRKREGKKTHTSGWAG